MRNYTVEFATSCYEKDWEFLLKTNRLRKMIEACNFKFDKITLYINNFKEYSEVKKWASKYKEEGIINDYVVIEEHAKEVLNFYEIEQKQGYYYLIQCLSAIYFSNCDYLLHFTCDAKLINDEEWIATAIRRMQKNKQFIVANAFNIADYNTAVQESFEADTDFYIGYGFSDQCCLLPTAFYRAPIYNEQNDLSSLFYPEKSRGSFEERVYRYMRNHRCYRITHRRSLYRHKNFPKDSLKRWLTLNLGINNKKYGLG